MSTLAPVETPQGEKRTYVFEPDPDGYTQRDFDWMAAHITDATMYGYAAMRLIYNDRFTITTIQGAKK